MSKQTFFAEVESFTPLTDSIVRLVLKPEHYVDYQAGQYLNILVDEEELSYSIANAPLGSHKYELHIRHSRDNINNQKLFAQLKMQGKARISLPFGECSMDKLDLKRPIIFIAGGTGFAQVKSMIEQLLASDDARSFELYWGARSQADLYLDEKVKQWQAHVPRFKYVSLISDEVKDRLGHTVVAHHGQDLAQWQIVLSGPFDMVFNARDVLLQQGIAANNLFADAFSFESR
ncbi:MAG: NAD(P)H-flavin reductase [Legionella sp.]|jgi:CDP-4-dehydro-6-deoxyglucose reductase